MATDRTGSKRPRRGLTGEDAELWERVARTTRPLKRRRPKAQPSEQADSLFESEPREPQAERPQRRPSREPPPKTTRIPPLARFDPKEARQLGGGRLRIEARVDLHGLTQREAHARLKSFLVAAQARGRRYVLVITGKGTARADEEEPFWQSRDCGVLKRLVPQWLAEPEFRGLVVGFTAAQARHGGEGALYVRLRRSR